MVSKGFEPVDLSLIKKVALDISVEDLAQPNWIFFSSRFGVESFFDLNIGVNDVKWGAIGGITAKTMREYIDEPIQFVGDSNDTREIASAFEKVCAGQTVWFPGSLKSKRIVQQHLDKVCQVIDLPIYDTVKRTAVVQESDVYIFTSPLNVDSFFDSNMIPMGAEIWAIGKTTEAALKHYTDLKIRLPKRSSVHAILERVVEERA